MATEEGLSTTEMVDRVASVASGHLFRALLIIKLIISIYKTDGSIRSISSAGVDFYAG